MKMKKNEGAVRGNSGRTSGNDKIYLMTTTGVLAAMITIFTAYIMHIPVGTNGGYIHFGDALIYIGASMLPLPYALAAAAIGGGLADLLTAPVWAPATIIIKMLIVLPFTSRKQSFICRRNIVAPVISLLVSGTCYYIAEWILFGNAAAPLASFAGSLVQSGGSAAIYWVLAAALDRAHFKTRVLPKLHIPVAVERREQIDG